MKTKQHQKTLANQAVQSHDAASLRLVDRPLPAPMGFYYDAPHLPLHARDWHLQRHLKRKRLHRSNHRYDVTERMGTCWSLLPMACLILVLVIVVWSLFVGYTSLSAAVGQRYQGDVATLADILPKDSLTREIVAGHHLVLMGSIFIAE